MLLGRVVVAHSGELLTARSHGSMAELADLRVEVASDARLVATGDGAFDLLAALALAYIATQLGFLLGRAILPVADRDGRSLPIPRA